MRDPARIRRMLEQIRQIWQRHPDLRLGQLIENAKVASGLHADADTFNVEDNRLEEGLERLVELTNTKKKRRY